MKFVDRLTDRTFDQLPEHLILGRWQAIAESESVVMNGVKQPNSFRSYLFGDVNDYWSLRSAEKSLNRRFQSWQFPSDLVAQSIRFFEQELQRLIRQKASWQQWVNTPPLASEIEQKIHLQPLARETKKRFGHLEAICHNPRTSLKIETERLPTSRAKRISPHAIEFLASHSEDWERLRFRSVIPKQVLALVREDQINIYENQVTVQLIDYLLDYLNRQIQDIKILRDELEQASYFSNETQNIDQIHWRNRERIFALLGNLADAETGLKEANDTLERLTQVHTKLRGLMQTDLYKSIPENFSVGTTLKRTNILVNDQHYRYVDKLWRQWSLWKQGRSKNAEQVFQDHQELFQGFESFCLLLICRALTGSDNKNDRGFGFQAVINEIPKRGNDPIWLSGIWGEISLHWKAQGVFCLHLPELTRDLHIIPMMLPLTATHNSEAIDAILAGFSEAINQNVKSTSKTPYFVILYPGTQEEREKLNIDLKTKVNRLSYSHSSKEIELSILPVTPLDILSLERVARVIQWWLHDQRYQSYPPILSKHIPSHLSEDLLSDANWLVKDHQFNQYRVLQQPTSEEIEFFQSNLNRLINEAKAKGPQAKGDCQQLQSLEDLSDLAKQLILPFKVCPVCHSIGDIVRSEKQSFYAECDQCGSAWGTRTCGHCHQNYPFIQVQATGLYRRDILTDEIEKILGRDVLAIPQHIDADRTHFICSCCGTPE
ncbi:hypothetical protein [Lyngbya sp. CCY1209]|uniref:hypothetical protein n=1 Tax=Lyngbya sp. CCY1209 TaxID=2886103 RepID=UPI002D2175AE|nr:hypothetical protein [Lyngbya sp. CCY1209]MEB3882007.1 hypothetical protein [Lyngbya sp. CCY1209]